MLRGHINDLEDSFISSNYESKILCQTPSHGINKCTILKSLSTFNSDQIWRATSFGISYCILNEGPILHLRHHTVIGPNLSP